jgi:hypothetical protein
MQSPQNLESFLALHIVGLSLQPLVLGHVCTRPKSGVFTVHGLMQQGRERDNIVGVLQLLLRNFSFVRATLCDDVMILITAAGAAKSFEEKCYVRRVFDELVVARNS